MPGSVDGVAGVCNGARVGGSAAGASGEDGDASSPKQLDPAEAGGAIGGVNDSG